MVWAIGAFLVLIIAGVVAGGYYQQFFRPPRVWAGSVRNVEFTMGDLVERIRVKQGLTGRVDLSIDPFQYLQDQLNAEVLRQAAPGLGIRITDEDVTAELRSRFTPQAAATDQVSPGQLEEEFDQNYRAFLERTKLSDADYRVIVEEEMTELQLRIIFAASIPETGDQVEVEWIHLDLNNTLVPEEVRDRLEIEEFGPVAAEIGAQSDFADASGYVGWVPQGAFPELDRALFGDDEDGIERLAIGEISPPVSSQDGSYIVHVLDQAEDTEIAIEMRAQLLNQAIIRWQLEQLTTGGRERWLRMNFDSDLYAWVADQVNISAPRNQQAPRAPQSPLGPR